MFRTFRNEQHYEAPDIGSLPQTLRVLDSIRQQRQQQRNLQQQLSSRVDDFKSTGYFTNLRNQASKIGSEGVNRIKAGHIGNDRNLLNEGQQLTQEALRINAINEGLGNQYKDQENNLHKLGTEDKYAITQPALDHLEQAHLLDTPEEIAKHIQESQGKVGYNIDLNAHDFVQQQGKKSKTNDVTSQNGYRQKTSEETQFGKNGAISDSDVNRWIDSDPKGRTKQALYDNVIDRKKEIVKGYLASGKPLPDWANGLDEEEISFKLLHPDPEAGEKDNRAWYERNRSFGIENPKTVGQEMLDIGRDKLRPFANLSQHLETSMKDVHPAARLGIKEKDVNATEGNFSGDYGGVGTTVTDKGKPLDLVTTSGNRLNINTKEQNHGELNGAIPFKVTNTQLGLVDKKSGDIKPLVVKSSDPAKTLRESMAYIDSLTPEERSKLTVKPLLRGSSFDASSVINTAFNASKQQRQAGNNEDANAIDDAGKQIAKMVQNGASSEELIAQINQGILKKYIGTGQVNEELIDPSANDVSQFENKTGKRLYDQSTWSDAERKLYNYVQKKQEEDKPVIKKLQEDKRLEGIRKNKAKEEMIETVTKGKKPVPEKSKYKLGNVEYSVDELKTMGYSEDEIKQAASKGLLQ